MSIKTTIMIQSNSNKETLKQIKERERKQADDVLKAKCNALANEKFGDEQVKRWSNANKGIWFLPVLSDEGENIAAMALMKPIDRHILSFASTKIEDEGLYTFLEACMRECFIASIEPDGAVNTDAGNSVIINDDEYFIPAANKFNKITEGKKVSFLKR